VSTVICIELCPICTFTYANEAMTMIRQLIERITALSSIAFILALTAAFAASPAKKTITIALPGAIDRVTFDPGRISEKEIRRLVALSPEIAPFNKMLVPEWLELCDQQNPAYKSCGEKLEKATLIENGRTNLRYIKERIALLKKGDFPAELQPVVKYLLDVQQFAYWAESRRLEYLISSNISSLLESYNGVQPSHHCAPQIKKIQQASNSAERFSLTGSEWTNCILKLHSQKLGTFPTQAWQDFLQHYDVQEEFVQENGSDE
jgi:hypothetical protein